MDPVTIAMLGSAALSGYQGWQQGRKADKMNQKAIDQAELEFGMRAPMRRQGMQALGQIEGAIDMGNIGFNSANPFAAARGPLQSTAKLGNWDRFQTSPQQIDMALSGVRPDELQFAQDALSATEMPRNGRMRFGNTGSGRTYTNDDRNHAQKQIADKVSRNLGFAGIGMDDLMGQSGVQPLGTRRPATTPRNAQRRGITPMGGR